MKNVSDQITGIRLRDRSGIKFSLKGGREGLFIPTGLKSNQRLLIAEGPTDCAALLDLGFNVVGRPSCTGGTQQLIDLVKQLLPPEVVLITDSDKAGISGGERLASALVGYVPSLRLIAPPIGIKDARDWKRKGVTASEIELMINATAVRRLSINMKVSV